MHPAVVDFAEGTWEPAQTVLDIGGRDVNGTLRHLWPDATWTVLDHIEDDEVDIVADAATWEPTGTWDLVLCTEVLEHTPDWRDVLATCRKATDGRLVVTCAGPGRRPHSALYEGPPLDGEHYANVYPDELADALAAAGFSRVEVNVAGYDLRAVAWP